MSDPLAVEVANRNRPSRALELLREWWRLHLLSQSGASSYADYLAYQKLLHQVRELLAEEDGADRTREQAASEQVGVQDEGKALSDAALDRLGRRKP
jgi:hypothetical protein